MNHNILLANSSQMRIITSIDFFCGELLPRRYADEAIGNQFSGIVAIGEIEEIGVDNDRWF